MKNFNRSFKLPSLQLTASAAVVAAATLCGPAFADTYYSMTSPTSAPNQKFQIYKISIVNNVAQLGTPIVDQGSVTCFNNCSLSGGVNAFSFDTQNSNFFFFDSNNISASIAPTLYFAPVSPGSATTTIGAVSGAPSNISSIYNVQFTGGAYYNNAIYAVANGSTTLYKIPIQTVGGSVAFAGDIQTFTLPVGGSGINYGDIAINNGILYGFTTGPTNGAQRIFYNYGLDGNTPILYQVDNGPRGMQLAFNADKSVLYANDIDGNWYSINTSTGARTSLNTTALAYGIIGDLAGASPVPGPLPILGAVAAFRATRRLRTRVRQSKQMISSNLETSKNSLPLI